MAGGVSAAGAVRATIGGGVLAALEDVINGVAASATNVGAVAVVDGGVGANDSVDTVAAGAGRLNVTSIPDGAVALAVVVLNASETLLAAVVVGLGESGSAAGVVAAKLVVPGVIVPAGTTGGLLEVVEGSAATGFGGLNLDSNDGGEHNSRDQGRCHCDIVL